jgi:DNA polymerase (family 10)
LGIALPIVEEIISHLRGLKEVFRISACGSLRRMKETIGDIDILVSSKEGKKVITAFTSLPVVKEVLLCGETKGSIITHDGVQVDLRVVDEGSFGSALQYFTGSKAHNIKLRDIAKRKGMKISEYGVFIGDKKIGGSKEEEIYEAIGLSWIPPELREDWGEVEMARGGRLPRIIEREDVVGDLHVHSDHSDGASSILELALKAKELGYRYIVICDHSRSARYANGLSVERLLAQMEEISRLNSRIDGVRILTGTEVDILKDGSLDYPDEILKRCDIVIGAIHQGFKLNVTQRICKAMENPHLDIVAHPTGRLISQREGYEVDVEVVMKEAARTNTALEINAYYDRLDLSDVNTKRAKELGVKFSIGTDAHSAQQLEMMQFGLGVARRGWCTKDDILNALPPEELLSR